VSPLATVLSTFAGVLLAGAALRDGFEALFHPDGRMMLSRALMRAWWRLGRRRPALLPLAGPLSLLTILASWLVLLVCGWALVLWPHFPEHFRYAPGADGDTLTDALYLSAVTLSTIGFGDVVPAADVLRLLVPVEAVLGFGLLTAAISWLLSVYPALSRRRSLAYELWLLRDALGARGALVQEQGRSAERLFGELLSRLVAVERDLVTLPLSYYFTERDPRFQLPGMMPWLLAVAQREVDDAAPPRTQLRARMLLAAIDDFALTVAAFQRSPGGTTEARLAAYADDHGSEIRGVQRGVGSDRHP
jgi:hypothetical protein